MKKNVAELKKQLIDVCIDTVKFIHNLVETIYCFLVIDVFSWHSQEGQLDLMTVLKYVDDILSKSLAFKLKVEPKFNRCSVVQVCEEADVIESII